MLLRSKCFCKKVSNIFWIWYMINRNFFFLNIMTNSVIFDINMLDFAMIDRIIFGNIEDCIIVGKDENWCWWNAEFLKELNSSDDLSWCVGDSHIFRISRGMSDRSLFVTDPGCRFIMYHEYISCEWFSIVWVCCPIWVRMTQDCKLMFLSFVDNREISSAF